MAHVRPFETKDGPALAAIYRECLSEASWLPSPSEDRSDVASDTRGEKVHVALASDEEPVGFISVWEPEAFIHHLYVRRVSRGRGVGALLLKSLDGALPKPWRLKCLEANQVARSYYLRRGWREVSNGNGEDGPFVVLQKT